MMWGLAFKAGLSRPLEGQIERAQAETRPVVKEVGLRRFAVGSGPTVEGSGS